VFSQAHAAELIQVDSLISSEAAMWLLSHQTKDGSFANIGRVIHSDMMGGNGDDPKSGDLALTAFVTTALLEARSAGLSGGMQDEALQAGLAYLQTKLQEATGLTHYATVLSLHALTLAHTQGLGETVVGGSAVGMLQELAVRDGTFTHWAPRGEKKGIKSDEGGKEVRRRFTVAEASGPEVEMTGYALHAMVLAEEGLAEGLPAVRWLLAERSDTGGWKSTQDTIVALEGLAAYAAEVSADPPQMDITVGSRKLMLAADNADVVQHVELSPGEEVAIRAQGSGMAVLTVTTAWHTSASPDAPALELAGEVAVNKAGGLESRVTLTRSEGPTQSGMMVAEIGMFSGYVATSASVAALNAACGGVVKRVETAPDGRVVVYLDALPVGKACELGVELEQEVRVDNIQAVPVEAYYYYTPDRRGSALMQPPVELSK
jgi:CD109 antigen